ncbi:MAG: tetratricopeptide repeat protein [Holosporales bacterium]
MNAHIKHGFSALALALSLGMPWYVAASDMSHNSHGADEGGKFHDNQDPNQGGASPETVPSSRGKLKRVDPLAGAEDDTNTPESASKRPKRLRDSNEVPQVDAPVALSKPKNLSETLQWIKAANDGDQIMQDQMVHLVYLRFIPLEVLENLALSKWSTDFEGWVMADLRRAYVVARSAPQLLRDRPQLIEKIRAFAENGHPEACFAMGVLYALKVVDLGTDENNDTEAVRWYRQVAEHGHVAAMNNLGIMLQEGRGVDGGQCPTNDVEAVKWYRQAAAQGFFAAMNHLGIMLEEGRGVEGGQCPANDAEAVKWYRQAAAQGHAWAMNNLGIMLQHRRGVQRDTHEAAYWLIKGGGVNTLKRFFKRNLSAPLETEALEAHEDSDLKILQKKVHEMAGEYLLTVMKHDPMSQVSDAMQAGRLPKMPGLAELYRPLSTLLTRAASLVEALEKPGILVNIVQRKSQEELVKAADNDAPSYGEWTLPAEGAAYRLFAHGQENVKNAAEIIELIAGTHPLWGAAQKDLCSIEEVQKQKFSNLWGKYETLELEYQAIESNLLMLQTLPEPSPQQREEMACLTASKTRLMREIGICVHVGTQAQADMERIQAVRSVPEELKIAVLSDLGRRNARFKQDHPWIDKLETD